jgi:hypothetical protein
LYKKFVNGKGIYYSLKKSNQRDTSKTLILGDSVGKQLFSNEKDNNLGYNSLACNQAIGLVGQFILLDNYLKAGNRPESVILFYSPFSFLNNLDEIYTYQYFLKPFYKRKYQPLFSKNVLNQIDKIPLHEFSQNSYLLTTNLVPEYISNDTSDYSLISPISEEYLVKMKKLSYKYNFEFLIIPTPVSLSDRSKIIKADLNEISNRFISSDLKKYFNRIIFINDTNFYPDKIHLKNPEMFSEYYIKNIYY